MIGIGIASGLETGTQHVASRSAARLLITKIRKEELMSVETKFTLNDSTIEKVQDLIQVNIDSYDGFKEVADKTDDIAIANLFRRLASERSDQASEL